MHSLWLCGDCLKTKPLGTMMSSETRMDLKSDDGGSR